MVQELRQHDEKHVAQQLPNPWLFEHGAELMGEWWTKKRLPETGQPRFTHRGRATAGALHSAG